MKRWVSMATALALAFLGSPAAWAYTPVTGGSVTVSATGTVDSTVSFDVTVVSQGTGDPGTPATLDFATGGNAFRDSGEAVRIAVDTNLAGNSVIAYTDNLSGSASPQYQGDTSTGIDGGGLVGVSDPTKTVPLLFAVLDNNTDHIFTTGTIGDDETFITDRAHVATFTVPVGSQMDNLNLVQCDGGATLPVPVNNTDNDGLYSQYFGAPGQNHDLCLAAGQGPVTLFGQGPGGSDIVVNDGDLVPAAQELAKNIAVTSYGWLGTSGTASNGAAITSPYFMPLGADFSAATAQDYGTSTLTFELITQ